MYLNDLGWNTGWESRFHPYAQEGRTPGRIARAARGIYYVLGENATWTAEISGAFRHHAQSPADFPAVGDWVALEPCAGEEKAVIHALLPRRSAFIRKAAGAVTEAQVAAANVDAVFLVAGLDGDYNVRRIERYLAAAYESGAAPVIVLNKADLCGDIAQIVEEVQSIAFGVPVFAVSAVEEDGAESLRPFAVSGQTVAFLGSSGVGKSSLINALLGEARQQVSEVRADDSRGRHTTTHRELIPVPGGGVLLDTPGMRELQLWGTEEGLEHAFADIEALAEDCRFRDCTHANEPGCAVQAALDTGALDAARFASYKKLQRELQYLARKQDQRAQIEEERKWKQIAKWQRQYKKEQR